MTHLETILAAARTALAAVTDTVGLEQVKARYLGKSGELTELLKQLGKLPPEERKTAGAAINETKQAFEAAFNARRDALAADKLAAQLAAEALDVTLPGRGQAQGGLHPVTLTLERITELFHSLGFAVADGPEIESDFHNFQALNIPANYVLIYGHWGFPELGAVGCAWATAMCMWFSALLWIGWILCSPVYRETHPFKWIEGIHFSTQKQLAKLAIPIGIMFFVEASAFSLIALIIAKLGTTTVASHGSCTGLSMPKRSARRMSGSRWSRT